MGMSPRPRSATISAHLSMLSNTPSSETDVTEDHDWARRSERRPSCDSSKSVTGTPRRRSRAPLQPVGQGEMRRHPSAVRMARAVAAGGSGVLAARGRRSSRALSLAAISRLSEPRSAAVLASSLIHGTAQAGLWEEEAAVVLSLCRTARGQRPLDRVLDVLVQALKDDQEAVAGRAEGFTCCRLGEAAAPAVTAAVQHSSAPHSCVWILGQIGGLVALDPLMQALDHSNARIRAEACAGLGKLRDPSRCNHSSEPPATPSTSSASRARCLGPLRHGRGYRGAIRAAWPSDPETLPNADNPPAVGSTKSQRRRPRPAQNGSSPRAKNGSSPGRRARCTLALN